MEKDYQLPERVIEKVRALAAADDFAALVAGSDELEGALAAGVIACERALGLTPFDEQLKAAYALTKGCIIGMNTGEGKTLAAVLAAYVLVKQGRRLHVLTFNDYLAKRDYNWMKPVYDLLGVKIACVTETTPRDERAAAYKADVVYLTARECGFDFLRDFIATDKRDIVHCGFDTAIVDEADSILVDEARLPLVIAGSFAVEDDPRLPEVSEFVSGLSQTDYAVSDENNSIYLTDSGADKAEKHYALDNLYDDENSDLFAIINDCLKAWFLLKRDVDYIVRDGRIMLIDAFTGRTSKDRNYPGMLQSAVEIRNGVSVTTRGRVLGSVPIQFFARQYKQLSGMTGTAAGSRDEFDDLYGLEVCAIPPHLPCVRVDHPTEVYFNAAVKWEKITQAIIAANAKGQPVLAGTGNIEESERLAEALRGHGITVSVLNAKNDEQEAAIIGNAGAFGAVTISTNMAGRGVDIKLGGADESSRDSVIEAGGLLVIGTALAESERMNAQLSGRAGRQGDIGESRTFAALDDELMTKFRLDTLATGKHYPREFTEEQLEDKVLLREVDRVQRISQGDTLETRKRLLKFNMIGEKHRDITFGTRSRFLSGESTPTIWQDEFPEEYENAVGKFGEDKTNELQRAAIIWGINETWADYIDYTEDLRQGIHLTCIGGKNPADEYNITCENYFLGIESDLIGIMGEALERLLSCESADDFRLNLPSEIHTYLLEGSGDELAKRGFLQKLLSSSEEEYSDDEEESYLAGSKDKPLEESTEEAPKQGLLKRLFGKKK